MTPVIIALAALGTPLAIVAVVLLLRKPIIRLIDRADEIKFPGGYVKTVKAEIRPVVSDSERVIPDRTESAERPRLTSAARESEMLQEK